MTPKQISKQHEPGAGSLLSPEEHVSGKRNRLSQHLFPTLDSSWLCNGNSEKTLWHLPIIKKQKTRVWTCNRNVPTPSNSPVFESRYLELAFLFSMNLKRTDIKESKTFRRGLLSLFHEFCEDNAPVRQSPQEAPSIIRSPSGSPPPRGS